MTSGEILSPESVVIRKLPINFNRDDFGLLEHELKATIPATRLLALDDVSVTPDGLLFRGGAILPESFVSPELLDYWKKPYARVKFLLKSLPCRHVEIIDREAFWFTDTWSDGYFHWMTDALPRLFAIRDRIVNAMLLLPGAYRNREYIVSSLRPFSVGEIRFIENIHRCRRLRVPSHTAPTGNYNESIITGIRRLFLDHVGWEHTGNPTDKIYISRGKAGKRKIVNEAETQAVLREYGFKTVYFEEHSFEEQVRIASHARYVVSNHGAGLTNMMFMEPGSSVLELRLQGDNLNNCYFALASASDLRYFYQLCDPEHPGRDPHSSNLLVDTGLLRRNIEQMLGS